ncbi:MAG: hypothetical protein EPN21_17860 [Methylococcaceae bacterium]|nr:MAG: hypothetical protein EPN21_17860 [Methylococcaceae bacterium]
MKHTLTLILLLTIGTAQAETAQATIKEEEVKALLQTMDSALQRKDIDGALQWVAAHAQIRLAVSTAQGPQILPLGRNEYREILNTTLSEATGYKVERQAPSITLGKDGKALYTDFAAETIQTKDKKTRTLSQERMLLEKVDGQLKIMVLESSVLTSK